MDQNYLEQLTPTQRAAVEHFQGAALVLAGPGSGKTRVITFRISHLIRHHSVRPGEIVAITFTNKASNEMRERVGKMLPPRIAESLRVSTFHSLCAGILRHEAKAAGIDPNYTISDEDDTKAYVMQATALTLNKEVKEVKGFKDFRDPNLVRRFISKMKQKVVTPEGLEEKLQDREGVSDADMFYLKVYTKYESILRRNQCVDFDDLIMRTVLLLRADEEVRNRYARWTHQLLVDEYQDTNKSQYELVRQLSSHHGNVMVVGDLDQSIYRFRGAEPKNLDRMETDYENLQTFFLEENFRSTPQIADVSNTLIGHNAHRKPKLIKPVAEDGAPVRVIETLDPKQEAAVVVQEIVEAADRKKASYKDFAILYRIHSKSRLFEELLVAMNVPHKVIGGVGFYNRAVVKDMLAYLKLLANPADEASFIRIYASPPRGFGDVAYAKVCGIREEFDVPIMHIFRDRTYEAYLSPRASQGAEKIRDVFVALHTMPKDKVAPLIETVIRETKYTAHLQKDRAVKSAEKATAQLEHLEELLIAAKEFDTGHGAGLLRFLEWVALMQTADEETDDDRVHLMTCHAAKGLEFSKLYVIGAIDGVMPIMKAEDDLGRPKSAEQMEADLEEERRIFFVALTRAEQQLTIMHTREQLRYNTLETCTPSRFLEELGATPELVAYANTNVGSHLVGILNKKKGGRRQNPGWGKGQGQGKPHKSGKSGKQNSFRF